MVLYARSRDSTELKWRSGWITSGKPRGRDAIAEGIILDNVTAADWEALQQKSSSDAPWRAHLRGRAHLEPQPRPLVHCKNLVLQARKDREIQPGADDVTTPDDPLDRWGGLPSGRVR